MKSAVLLRDSDLQDQVERVRITAQPLSLEEMSKLWMTFQTQYRISAAYEVVRGADRGYTAQGTTLPVRVPPNILCLDIPHDRRSMRSRHRSSCRAVSLTIKGTESESRWRSQLRFGTARLSHPDPNTATDQHLNVTPACGPYAQASTPCRWCRNSPLGTPPVPHPGTGFESNVAAFVLAPRITTLPPISVGARGDAHSLGNAARLS